MPNTWHIDYVNGTDTTNDGLGWWKVAYTLGNGTQPVADETATGGTSGSTAKVISVVVTSGTWAGGDAAGTIYWYGKSAAFVAETLTFAVGATCAIAADFSVSSVKTMQGVTAAMSAPGDTMKLAKSTDPVSIGNATWTNDSATVTLAAAQTITVDACDGAAGDWVASANVTESKELTIYKEGTGARKFVVATAFTTGIIAYKDLATLDLSTKQKITFWIRSTVQLAANTLRLDLCSDNVGAVPVNSFTIPHILEANRWYPLTFNPDAGAGNLGNAIESVSLVVLIADIAATSIYLDNIEASPTNGLNLQSVIGKNTDWPETFWCLKSILGTTVILAGSQQQGTDVTKYYGTTELVATYDRETVKTVLAIGSGTAIQTLQEGGTAAAHMNYVGGYDTATNTRNGETWFDGTFGWGYGITTVSNVSYCDFSYIGFIRYNYNSLIYTNIGGIHETLHINGATSVGLYMPSTAQYSISANNICCVQNTLTGVLSYSDGNSFSNLAVLSNGSGLAFGGSANTISNLIAKGNIYNINKDSAKTGVKNRIYTAKLANAITSDFYIQGFGMEILCENVEMLSTTEITAATTVSSYSGTIIASQKHDKTNGLHKIYVLYDGLIEGTFYTIVIDTVIPGGGAFSTRVIPGNTATQKTEATCLIEPVADAGNLTVSVDVRESVVGDGTDYNGGRIELVAKKNVAIGIAADTVIATATVASEGAFETISGSLTGAGITITDNGAVEFVIRCQGAAASTGWINFSNVVIA